MGLMDMFDSGGGGSSTEEESRQRTKRRRQRNRERKRRKKKKRSAFLNNFSFRNKKKKTKKETKKTKKSSVQKWKESDDAAKLRKDYQEADSHLGRFDVAARGGFDFLLDNPSASVQDSTRGVLKKSYEAGAGRKVSDQELVDAYADSADRSKKKWDDATPDSRALKWTGAAADFLIADTAKAAGTAVTGVDIDERTAEGTVGAAEAFDVGVTLGTFGVGKVAGAGVKGAAKSGQGGSLLSRVGLTKGDDAGTTAAKATKGADETAAASRTSRASKTADDTDDLLPVVRQADEAGTTAAKARRTAAAKSAKEGDESSGLVSRISTRAGKLSDDATRAGSRTRRAAGTAAGKAGTFGSKAAGKTGKAGGKVAGSKTVKYGTGGAIAIGGGGLLYDYLQSNNEVTVEDPDTGELYRLTKADSYQPTEDHPEGGTSWRVDRIETATATDPETGEETTTTVGFDTIGYTVIVGVAGKNVYILGQDGERVRSRATSETWNKAREARAPGGRV